jgi:hypothetical protein
MASIGLYLGDLRYAPRSESFHAYSAPHLLI